MLLSSCGIPVSPGIIIHPNSLNKVEDLSNL